VIIAELYDSVLKFAQGTAQQDDLTAVLIKRSALKVPGNGSQSSPQTLIAVPQPI
jgi:hypothetical protein